MKYATAVPLYLTGMGSTCIIESVQVKHIFPLIQLLYIVQL